MLSFDSCSIVLNKTLKMIKLLITAFLFLFLISNGNACLKTIAKMNREAAELIPLFEEYQNAKNRIDKIKTEFVLPEVLKGCRQRTIDSARVFLTVSSLPSQNGYSDRRLELNWYNVMPKKGDWVGLYTSDPCTDLSAKPIKHIQVVDHPDNYYLTDVYFPRPKFHLSHLSVKCLGFWIIYVRGDLILDSECKKSQPQWMWENRQSIEDLTLSQLMIPGTHLSGSYQMNSTGRDSLDSMIGPFETTQDEDIWNQLVYGNRYLELSVALHVKTREHWLQFDDFLANPLIPALNQVRNFVEATNEIVVIDIHNFLKGFTFHNVSVSRRHRLLVHKLNDILQPYLISKSVGFNATLKDLWAMNKRIYISYNNENFIHDQHLWPGIPHFLVETVKMEMLITYFEKFSPSISMKLWTAQAHLTPNDVFKVTQANSSLRHLAHISNRYFTEWFRDFWWDKANVVATDFFLGNNLIEVAIEINQEIKKMYRL